MLFLTRPAALFLVQRMNNLCKVIVLQTAFVPYFQNTTEKAGHAVAQFVEALRYKAEGLTGLISDGVIGIFHLPAPYGCTMFLGSTQPVTEMRTRGLSWSKGCRCLDLHVLIVQKFWENENPGTLKAVILKISAVICHRVMHIVVTVGASVYGRSRVQYCSCTPPFSLNNLSATKAFQMYPTLLSVSCIITALRNIWN